MIYKQHIDTGPDPALPINQSINQFIIKCSLNIETLVSEHLALGIQPSTGTTEPQQPLQVKTQVSGNQWFAFSTGTGNLSQSALTVVYSPLSGTTMVERAPCWCQDLGVAHQLPQKTYSKTNLFRVHLDSP